MTARERTLGLAFAGVLLAGGAFLGGMLLSQWKARVDAGEYDLELRAAEAEILLDQEQLWKQRRQWVTSELPVYTKGPDAELYLLELLEKSPSKFGVEVFERQPMEGVDQGDLVSARVSVKGRGEFQDVMKWLYELQHPDQFIAIPAFNLSPNEEETSMINVSLVVEKWFQRDLTGDRSTAEEEDPS
ncbi:MAG: hypothetical protein KDK99_06120 [Verrucomicrobiales bacterium]|nr:hypothetical protein [Verrucomicrobiales bacterium]